MGRLRTWIDWSVLALCMAAATGAVVCGVGAGIQARPTPGALAVIVALTAVNCGFLLGAAVCRVRSHVRLKPR